jgi:hypothetical protein
VARLRIPQTARLPLVRLVNASQADFETLVEGLRSEKPLLARRELTRRLLERTTDLDEDDIKEFLDVTLSLATLRVDRNVTAEQLAEEISTATDLQIPDEARPELRNRLTTILKVPSVQQLSKAADLLSRDERVFHQARLTTDMRPIFEEDPSKVPSGAVVVHKLTIEFHTAAGVEEWQVALDENDLSSLRGIVNRAALKGQALHQFMENAHLMGYEPAE